jgi:hypothetical protein
MVIFAMFFFVLISFTNLKKITNLIFSLTTHQIQGMNKTSLEIEKCKNNKKDRTNY